MTTTSAQVPSIQFHDGNAIPQLGYGVWQVPDDEASDVVGRAIRAGYRHVDTARIYANEAGVGEAVRASGVPREELFVTTKLWNDDHGRDRVRPALEASLARLDMDHVDLYLIHWAKPLQGLYVETWAAMSELVDAGLARSVGVSNFPAVQLEEIIDATGVVPVIHQLELHPYLQQHELRALHERHGIVTEGWSPIGRGGDLLADPVVVDVARELGVTPAQAVLRWHLQHGFVTIPKSATPARIVENIDLFGFELSADQVDRIDALDRGEAGRIGPDPAGVTF